MSDNTDTLDVPAEAGEHDVDGFTVTVEPNYPKTLSDGENTYSARPVAEDTFVLVYEDADGDYWLEHKNHNNGPVLVSKNSNTLYDAIESAVEDV